MHSSGNLDARRSIPEGPRRYKCVWQDRGYGQSKGSKGGIADSNRQNGTLLAQIMDSSTLHLVTRLLILTPIGVWPSQPGSAAIWGAGRPGGRCPAKQGQ